MKKKNKDKSLIYIVKEKKTFSTTRTHSLIKKNIGRDIRVKQYEEIDKKKNLSIASYRCRDSIVRVSGKACEFQLAVRYIFAATRGRELCMCVCIGKGHKYTWESVVFELVFQRVVS